MSTYQHVLVGLDLSEESNQVLSKASSLAKLNSARLSVAHIVEPLTFAYGGDVPIDMSTAQTTVEEQANLRLGKLLNENGLDSATPFVSVGQTASELHRLAKEHKVDLIVVGCHGRHGIALLFGSTSNGVLHGTHCDVLAVKV
jgi:universal stress protein A